MLAKSFEELLEIGRNNIIKSVLNLDDKTHNLTGIESQLIESGSVKPMLKLNYHMYTTYSTNHYGSALSVQGELPLSKVKAIIPILKSKGYFFSAYDHINNKLVDSFIDPDILSNALSIAFGSANNTHDLYTSSVLTLHDAYKNGSSINIYKNEFIDGIPNNLKIHIDDTIKNLPNEIYLFHLRDTYLFLPNMKDNVEQFHNMLESDDTGLIDFDIKSDPMCSLLIEDPIVDRKSLYYDVYSMFEQSKNDN